MESLKFESGLGYCNYRIISYYLVYFVSAVLSHLLVGWYDALYKRSVMFLRGTLLQRLVICAMAVW